MILIHKENSTFNWPYKLFKLVKNFVILYGFKNKLSQPTIPKDIICELWTSNVFQTTKYIFETLQKMTSHTLVLILMIQRTKFYFENWYLIKNHFDRNSIWIYVEDSTGYKVNFYSILSQTMYYGKQINSDH